MKNVSLLLLALLVLSLFSGPNRAEDQDGILHTFYGLNLEIDGRRVGSVNTSDNVVLGTPIIANFEGRCQVSFVFESGRTEGYRLVLTVREAMEDEADEFGLPIDHVYDIQLDEQLQFNIQTNKGLILSGNLKLAKVSRLEIAD